ncbi:Aste57867_334 [Aphanomyces stellatus]|uniref:Aste57867_334 protein n=1 Tax=Aphanomyces stellatus TaxID=120398 RepID=A0A485K2C3_9STRA|nr:hypothetical protein As57867_000334 [Aphanomyces stellatus]VFT77560.1 Aste57867_334 [Aphanomyces stellatus]
MSDNPNSNGMVPVRLQCQYAYKPCTNKRTVKRDGDVHKLCTYHRDRANSVQKIYATKRRQRAREARECNNTTNEASPFEPIPFTANGPLALQAADIVTLDLLFSEVTPMHADDSSVALDLSWDDWLSVVPL